MSLLDLRQQRKKRKPHFVVKEFHKIKRVKDRWRAARGVHSYVRQMHRGRPAQPTPGFGSPRAVYGLHQSGLKPVIVYTAKELLAVQSKSEGAILAANLGRKARTMLVQLATERKIRLLNVRNPAVTLDQWDKELKERKAVRQKKMSDKSKKHEEKNKRAAEKKKKAESKNKEEHPEHAQTADEQRELAEKVLTHK